MKEEELMFEYNGFRLSWIMAMKLFTLRILRRKNSHYLDLTT